MSRGGLVLGSDCHGSVAHIRFYRPNEYIVQRLMACITAEEGHAARSQKIRLAIFGWIPTSIHTRHSLEIICAPHHRRLLNLLPMATTALTPRMVARPYKIRRPPHPPYLPRVVLCLTWQLVRTRKNRLADVLLCSASRTWEKVVTKTKLSRRGDRRRIYGETRVVLKRDYVTRDTYVTVHDGVPCVQLAFPNGLAPSHNYHGTKIRLA
ncbi:hypothetical protein GQ44DRAFT_393515 [Phaeosphaeriaceae sp. PMI808]|nr:hypothetical protein GQ44DRAFT_393515 [Phaeosphaeriaceae sp. PMI808]